MTSKTGLISSTNITVSVVTTLFGEANQLPQWLQQIPLWVDDVVLVAEVDAWISERVKQVLPPHVRVIRRPANSRECALAVGLKAAAGNIIVVMAVDGSHDPSEIPLLCDKLRGGADYVVASRFRQGGKSTHMGRVRRFRNWALTMGGNVLFGGHYTDLCYGYIAFWRHLLTVLVPQGEEDYDDDNLKVALNLRALRCGLKIAEVPSHQRQPLCIATTNGIKYK